METVIATFGGILLLLSVGGGMLMKLNCLQANSHSLKGDRIAAGLIGTGLVANAIVISVGAPAVSLLATFGITAVVVLLYALYLLLERQQ